MSEIKSEKAMEALKKLRFNKANIDYCIANNIVNGTIYIDIANIVSIAETELTESHAKELQELKDKACKLICIAMCSGMECIAINKQCTRYKNFITELNK